METEKEGNLQVIQIMGKSFNFKQTYSPFIFFLHLSLPTSFFPFIFPTPCFSFLFLAFILFSFCNYFFNFFIPSNFFLFLLFFFFYYFFLFPLFPFFPVEKKTPFVSFSCLPFLLLPFH